MTNFPYYLGGSCLRRLESARIELSSVQLVHKFAATLSNTMIHKQFKNDKKGFGKFGPLAEGRGVSTLGEDLRFLLSFTRQACRDTWFHPKSFTGHPIDHLLCRSRDHRFLGASRVLSETTLSEAWSAYTDHNPIEVHLVKGWVFRVPPPSHSKMRRPNWRALRGSGESATVAREALAAELDRRVGLEPPVSWSEVVDLGLGVAKAVLGEEPKSDPRPWGERV